MLVIVLNNGTGHKDQGKNFLFFGEFEGSVNRQQIFILTIESLSFVSVISNGPIPTLSSRTAASTFRIVISNGCQAGEIFFSFPFLWGVYNNTFIQVSSF
jgi:hypothetical protein